MSVTRDRRQDRSVRARLFIVNVVLLFVLCGIATAADGIHAPRWVFERQVSYTVRCPRQVASSLAHLEWERQQRHDAERYVTQNPEKAATFGSLAWQRYWLRVYDQTERLLEQLCR